MTVTVDLRNDICSNEVQGELIPFEQQNAVKGEMTLRLERDATQVKRPAYPVTEVS